MVISDLIRATRVTFGDNSRTALKRRHLLRDASGAVVETPEEMLARVAEAIASVEPEAATRRPLARRFYDDVRADVPRLRDAARVRGALSVVRIVQLFEVRVRQALGAYTGTTKAKLR